MSRGICWFLIVVGSALAAPQAPVGTRPAGALQEALSEEQLSTIARALVEGRKACEADGGTLWGRPLWGPMMVVVPATRQFVALEAVPGLTRSAGVAGEQLHLGTLPPEVPLANTAIEFAGKRWSMVLWPLPEAPEAQRQLLCHEQWHRVQAELGFPLETPPCDHLDDEQGRAGLRLEMRALARALREGGKARVEATADALAFRAARHAAFTGSAEAERKLELSEGLAEYTGLRLSGRTDLHEWAAAHLEAMEQRESFVRSFPYATGPAYALLLDEATPGWRSELPKDIGLAEALRASLEAGGARLSAHDPESLEVAAARYDGAVVREQERARSAQRQARRRELQAALVAGPVLELPLSEAQLSFDPGRVTPLPPEGSVYAGATIVDAWGELAATGADVLVSPDWKRAAVPARKAPVAEGDGSWSGEGWRLRLKPGWRVLERDGGGWRVARD